VYRSEHLLIPIEAPLFAGLSARSFPSISRWLGVQATPISHPRTVSDKKVVALYVLSSVYCSKKANTDAVEIRKLETSAHLVILVD
jgi:hypothetical protein